MCKVGVNTIRITSFHCDITLMLHIRKFQSKCTFCRPNVCIWKYRLESGEELSVKFQCSLKYYRDIRFYDVYTLSRAFLIIIIPLPHSNVSPLAGIRGIAPRTGVIRTFMIWHWGLNEMRDMSRTIFVRALFNKCIAPLGRVVDNPTLV